MFTERLWTARNNQTYLTFHHLNCDQNRFAGQPSIARRHLPTKNQMDVMAKSELLRLRAAHATVAKLVADDLVYLPIFKRLEAELLAAEARDQGDAIAYARAAISVQNAMP
ncbi:MAG: hypothetical protein JWQ22_734 [Devosia sp.]|nr:hypothetical protein [Devosia sp.]